MKKPLDFGFLCEDDAHKAFLSAYLQKQYPTFFQENPEFGWRIYASNATEVENQIPNAIRFAFVDLSLDILFVGRDSDTSVEKNIQELKDRLKTLCNTHPKVLFMVPVQCVEHWLWYLKWKLENPISTKNVDLEPHNNRDAKRAVYGGKLNVMKQLEIANELLETLDIPYLESRSTSFGHFHQQVQKFLEKTSSP